MNNNGPTRRTGINETLGLGEAETFLTQLEYSKELQVLEAVQYFSSSARSEEGNLESALLSNRDTHELTVTLPASATPTCFRESWEGCL